MRILAVFLSIILITSIHLGISASAANGDLIEDIDGVRFVMKEIPSGGFMMDDVLTDKPLGFERSINQSQEIEQWEILMDSFYMAETETTWELYQLCIDEGACGYNEADGGDNGWGKATRPVIEISRDEVTEMFIPWLNSKTGKNYRLPTEAEWEYAARAGSTTRYSWGDEIDCSQARYGYASNECGGQLGTDPVKSYPPNAFGLYDMHGNVWEMVADCWTESASSCPQPNEEPCQEFVLRGGSWLNDGAELCSAFRFRHHRSYRESGDGFRLALSE